MLDCQTIRDVGRVLPWLASEPRSESNTTDTLLQKLPDGPAEGLRRRYDSTYPVIDQVRRKLAAALEELTPDDIADPEGEAAEALESAEAHFHTRRDDLSRLRNALTDGGATPHHDALEALEDLDGMYAELVATMQELRWKMLVAEGLRTTPGDHTFTSGTELMAALDDWTG